ncbi:MAG: Omp28-related outer membrane protein, partial [Bacteroidales bacterium]|nr:Omp28-related outer membrane protein [Bacteroidales bacterium]
MKRLFTIGLGLLWLSGAAAMAQETPTMVSTEAQNRKILIEEFTGVGCTYCPLGHLSANNVAAAYPEQTIIINIHQGSLATGYTPDLTTSYGDALFNQTGAGGYPSGTISRHLFPDNKTLAVDYNNWGTVAPEMLALPSYVNVGAKASIDWATRKLTVDVEIYYTAKPEVASNFVNVALLQDNIIGYQNGMDKNPAQVVYGQYKHMHAFRDFLTGQWGDEITDLAAGKLIKKTYEKDLPESIMDIDLKLEDLSVVVYIAESRKEIMNACHASMTHIGAPAHIVRLLGAEQLPYMACAAEGKAQLRIANILGDEAITSLTVEAVSAAGTQAIELTPSDFTVGKDMSVEVGPFPVFVNYRDSVAFRLVKVNGEAYTWTDQNSAKTAFLKWGGYTSAIPVTLNLVQDQFGDDITWVLTQGEETLQTGGPYRELNAPGTRANTVKLDKATALGCYVLTVYDKNHDGIHTDKGDGYIELKDETGAVFVQMDGIYTDSVQICFAVTGVANENATAAAYDLSIRPNPVTAADAELYLTATQPETLSVAI